jgi:hypothetical protein
MHAVIRDKMKNKEWKNESNYEKVREKVDGM